MKSTCFIIHPIKILLLKMVAIFVFKKTPISHPPLSQFNRNFHKTNHRRYTKDRFSLDIEEKRREEKRIESTKYLGPLYT
jgi:hypothetical protein